jgi:hypothetical protein
VTEEVNQALQDPISAIIYQIATTTAGTDYTKINKLYGSIGSEKLAKLIEISDLKEINNRVKLADEEARIFNKETIFSLLKNNLNSIELHHLCTDIARICTARESVNITGLRQIHQKMFEFMNDMNALAQLDEYKGDIPFSINTFCKVLDPNQLNTKV